MKKINESSKDKLLYFKNLSYIKINKNSNKKYQKIKIYLNRKYKIKYKYILIILFLIILIVNIIRRNKKLSFITEKKEDIEIEIDKNITIPSNKYKNRQNYNIINTDEMNKFIKLCNNGILLNKIPKISKNPKITALLPVYNANKYIMSTIRSIQNQNIEDIEIIIVDDCSSDNSLELIEKLQEEDKRIKLIKNKINRGTLYSRSIGALNANGKYIMTIDNDDLFINDIFNISYEEAENDDIQINKLIYYLKITLVI